MKFVKRAGKWRRILGTYIFFLWPQTQPPTPSTSPHFPPCFPPVFPRFAPVFLTLGDKDGFGVGDHGPLTAALCIVWFLPFG